MKNGALASLSLQENERKWQKKIASFVVKETKRNYHFLLVHEGVIFWMWFMQNCADISRLSLLVVYFLESKNEKWKN